ncbi:MAG: hypothetical protein LW696_02340 [Alphaproteobacteria bacterium]|jgi:hypothetical protein|nr:hypothetical protein [Alphaproteobacteria bacterium]
MRVNIFFYSLLILFSSLFAAGKVLPETNRKDLNQPIQKKSKAKPRFTTSTKYSASVEKPVDSRARWTKWLNLRKIPKQRDEKVLVSPASSMDSRDTTISAITQDSALFSPRLKVSPRVGNNQSLKIVPADSELNDAVVSSNDSLATTQVERLPAHSSSSLAGTDVLMPAAAPLQMESHFSSGPDMSSQEIYDVPKTKEAIERKRRNLYDALKDWHSDLATKRAESIRLQNEIAHLKLTQIRGEQRRKEGELRDCHDDIDWIQGHINRCNNQLAKLPMEDIEEKPRSKARRGGVILEVIN